MQIFGCFQETLKQFFNTVIVDNSSHKQAEQEQEAQENTQGVFDNKNEMQEVQQKPSNIQSNIQSTISDPTAHLVWKQANQNDILQFYEVKKILGKGAFGVVRQGLEKKTNKEVAIKTIPKHKITNQNDKLDVIREISIMNLVSGHSNVVYIKDTYEDRNYIHLVMELCKGGELFESIVSRGMYTEKDAAEIFKQMVNCVAHLHDLGVFHRDLKPENFLLNDGSQEAEIKATDFGLSVFFKPQQKFKDLVGSPYYVAPEVLRRCYTYQADLWSLGVILYILLSGLPPFWGEKEDQIFRMIIKGDVDFKSDPWPKISPSAKDLIMKLLNKDPSQRIKPQQILQHKWMLEVVKQDKKDMANLDNAVMSRMQKFAGMTKFKKLAMITIGQCLSPQEIVGIKQLFESIDEDNSGEITVDEFENAMVKQGHKMNREQIQKIVQNADIDGDGTINYNEFLGAVLSMSQFQKEDHMRAAFQKIDTDQSGMISIDELKIALKNLQMDSSEAETVIATADLNNDGQIDYYEFCQMVNSQEEKKYKSQLSMENSSKLNLPNV